MPKVLKWIATLCIVTLTLSFACATKEPAPVPEATPMPARAAPAGGAAWEIEWEKTMAAAKKERRVVMLTAFGMAPARDALIEGLRNKYGIELEVLPGRGGELAAKVLSERRAGIYGFDLYSGGASTAIDVLIPNGVFNPIRPYLILPEVTDPKLWTDIYGKGDIPIHDKGGYLIMTVGEANSSIAINTDMVKPQEIRRNKDLMNPKWKGKIVMDLPTRSGSGNTWLYSAAYLLGYSQDFFRDFLKQQQPVVNADSRQLVEWLAQGKMYIGVGAATSYVEPMRALGAPVMMVSDMDEKLYVSGGGGYFAAVNKPPHPNAQKVALNFLLGKEGQTIISKTLVNPSLRLDVPTDHLNRGSLPIVGKVHFQREEDAIGKAEVYGWSAKIMKEMGY